jgi:hypothetical protein
MTSKSKAIEGNVEGHGATAHPKATDDDAEGHGATAHPKATEDDAEGHGATAHPKATEDDDVEGHSIGVMNPILARELSRARERDIQREASRNSLIGEAKRALGRKR